MANEQNIIPHQFKPGQSGNPRGQSAKARQKKREKDEIERHLTKLFGTRRARQLIKDPLNAPMIDTMAQRATISELQQIAKDPASTAYEVTIAMSIINDAKNGKTTTIDKIAERLHGKPTQRMEITGRDGADFMPARVLTKKEAKELLDGLENEY